MQISKFVFGFQAYVGSVVYEKRRQIYNHDIFRLFIVIYVTLTNLTEQA